MAIDFAHAAAGANADFLSVFQPTGRVAARGQHPKLVVARNDSSVPTINMFIDGDTSLGSFKYAGSIIDACVDRTTYALRCTSGPSFVGANTCGPNAQIVTVTSGADFYRISTATSTKTAGHNVVGTLQETCNLQGTTRAVCSGTIGGSVDKTTTSVSTTVTYTGASYRRYDVAITAGAEKTASPSAECKAAGSSGASTKGVAVWGLVGAFAFALFL
ncbi:hypothetical protein QBC43DRAFT_50025 [Cladorrhinum sp. PSN259]|nr:hypothetical protein QBC43DRAFT_50025 [Cladorrhinum sp. PSN259]